MAGDGLKQHVDRLHGARRWWMLAIIAAAGVTGAIVVYDHLSDRSKRELTFNSSPVQQREFIPVDMPESEDRSRIAIGPVSLTLRCQQVTDVSTLSGFVTFEYKGVRCLFHEPRRHRDDQHLIQAQLQQIPSRYQGDEVDLRFMVYSFSQDQLDVLKAEGHEKFGQAVLALKRFLSPRDLIAVSKIRLNPLKGYS